MGNMVQIHGVKVTMLMTLKDQINVVQTVVLGLSPKVRGGVVNLVITVKHLLVVLQPVVYVQLAKLQILSTLRVITVVHINGPPQEHNPQLHARVVPIAMLDPTVQMEHVRHRHATHAQRARYRAREEFVRIAR